jgi:hypothetical protein
MLGSILLPLAAAVISLGLVAGVVAAVVNYMTIMEESPAHPIMTA